MSPESRTTSLPPAFVVGALYDVLLQSALRRFFDRARFETEAIPSASSDGRLSIEPTREPDALAIRWFGSRHILRVPPEAPFTAHETRLARAIGSVLAARYRALFDPRLVAERGELFQGSIDDLYVGAFLAGGTYQVDDGDNRADRAASAIEALRVAALSSYENRPISSGVVLLEGDVDPCRPSEPVAAAGAMYSQMLTGAKTFYRLSDGLHTVFLVNQAGRVVDVVDIARWAVQSCRGESLRVPCADPFRPHALATLGRGHVCVVLSPSHEIKVFAEGAQIFTFRNAGWHLLDIQAKYEIWEGAVGNAVLAERLFQTALNLADTRHGALFVVLRDPGTAMPQLVGPAHRIGAPRQGERPARRELLAMLLHRRVTDLDSSVLTALATMDGATVVDGTGRLLAGGTILLHPPMPGEEAHEVAEGARTTAAMTAARFGPTLKVSEDGLISFFDGRKIWDI